MIIMIIIIIIIWVALGGPSAGWTASAREALRPASNNK